MALKPNTPSRARSTTELVRIRATDGDAVIQVPKETAEMLLRSKGDYELVDEAGKTVAKKSGKKSGKKSSDGGHSEPSGTGAGALVKPVWPAGTADAWAAYAGQLGIATDGLDRTGIRDAVEAHEAAAANQ